MTISDTNTSEKAGNDPRIELSTPNNSLEIKATKVDSASHIEARNTDSETLNGTVSSREEKGAICTSEEQNPKNPANPIVERLTVLLNEYIAKTSAELSMRAIEVVLKTPSKEVPQVKIHMVKHIIQEGQGPVAETVGSVARILCKSLLTDGTRSMKVHERDYYQPVAVKIGTGSKFNKALEAFAATMRCGEVSYFECPAANILGENVQIGPNLQLRDDHHYCAVVELTALDYQRPLPRNAQELLDYAREDSEALDDDFRQLKSMEAAPLPKVQKLLKQLRNLLQKGMHNTYNITPELGVQLVAERRKVIERIVFLMWRLQEFEKAAQFVNNELLMRTYTDVKAYQLAIHSYLKAHCFDEAAEHLRQALMQHGNANELTRLSKLVQKQRTKHESAKGTSFMKPGVWNKVGEDASR